jgi:hypothetical protein
MTQLTEVFQGWLGWCPNHPVMHTAPVVLPAPQTTLQVLGSPAGSWLYGPGDCHYRSLFDWYCRAGPENNKNPGVTVLRICRDDRLKTVSR